MRNLKIRKACQISFLLPFLLFISFVSKTALGENLLDVYKLALQNNPGWAAKRSAAQAGKEYEKLGQSGLLPQIAANFDYSQINYDSPAGVPSLTNVENNGLSEIANCVLNPNAGNFTDCINTNDAAQNCLSLNLLECFFGATSGSSSFTSQTYGISLTQPIFRMDKWYEYRRGQAFSDRAKTEFKIAFQDFNLRVVETYFNVLKAQEDLAFANKEDKSIYYQLKSTKKRYEQGIVTSLDVYEAQSIYDLHQASKLLAETRVANALEDLHKITGFEVDEISTLPLNIPLEAPQPAAIEAWVGLSVKNNPNLELAEISTKIANRQHQIARARKLPQVDFLAAYGITDSGGETTSLAQGETSSTSFSFNLRVPIYTGGALTASERQSKYKKVESDFLRNEIFQVTVATVKKLYRSTQSALKRASAHAVAINSSEKALKAVSKGYQRGKRTVPEFMNAQRDYYVAKKNYAQARLDYVLASLKLKRSAGLMNQTDLETLNSWLVADSTDHTIQTPVRNTNDQRSGGLFQVIKP